MKRGIRRIALPGLALVALAAAANPATAATLDPVAGGCSVNAAATVKPGLTMASKPFTYSYTGTLSNCFYTGTGAVAHSGIISAGTTISIDGHLYQEPTPTGNGSCLATSATGYDFTRWDNGHQTIVQFSSTSVGGITVVSGHVVDSLLLTAVDPGPGDPKTALFVTNQYNGQTVAGALDFGASNFTVCTTSAGLVNATITGELTHTRVVS